MSGLANVNFQLNDESGVNIETIEDFLADESHESPALTRNQSFSSVNELHKDAGVVKFSKATFSSSSVAVANLPSQNTLRENLSIISLVPPGHEKKPKSKKGTSNLESLMHMVKANIGTGVLAMPLAFKNAGLVLGSVGLWFMAVICVHCMHILLKCQSHVVLTYSKNKDAKYVLEKLGYDDVVKLLIKEKSPPGKKWSKWSKLVVSIFLVIGQLGFCCVYLVFIPTNLKQVIDVHSPNGPSVQVLMCIILLPLILFCMIKNLKILAPFSTFANFLMIASMLVILVELFFSSQPFKKIDELDLVAPYANWPIYFSSAIYAFEGISLVLPVQNEMRNKEAFRPWNGVLNTAMSLVAIMYFSIGFYGYLKYGSDAQASITLNLPNEFYVAADIIWSYVFKTSKYLQSLAIQKETSITVNTEKEKLIVEKSASKVLNLIENVFRSCLVIFTFLLAILIPKIDLFISLVGAVASSTLALIIPPLLEFLIVWNTPERTKFLIFKNVAIILFGFYIFFAGTYVSLRDIFDYFRN